jgi:phosphate propanoyltransferase
VNEEKLRELIRAIISEENADNLAIPIGVSNHHIHLTPEDFAILFPGQEITMKSKLKQVADFAANQTVTVVGPKGEIRNVRLLGPFRAHSQIELAKSEARQIGVEAPIRLSGDLDGTPSVLVKTPFAELMIQGVIVAKRHIHMSLDDAKTLDVKLGDSVSVEIKTEQRTTLFKDVIARPRHDFLLEMHLDTDEANAANIGKNSVAHLVKQEE